MQFTETGSYVYRVYDPITRLQITPVGWGTIKVEQHKRLTDQRDVALPQRGTFNLYKCDIGVYEFVPWVVGKPLPGHRRRPGSRRPHGT